MKILNVGDRVEAGPYRLHSRFRCVSNYLLEAGRPRPALRREGAAPPAAYLLCLVNSSVGSGPINMVLDGAPPEADALTMESDALLIEHHRYALGRRYDSSLPTSPINPDMLAVLGEHLPAKAHPKSLAFLLDPSRTSNFRAGFEQNLVRQIQEGAAKLFSADPAQGVRLLRGCGFGLTPSGDDFLAGMMIGLHRMAGRARSPLRAALSAAEGPAALPAPAVQNILSAAFLALAAEGRVNEAMKQLVVALTGDKAQNVRLAAERVLAQGETSGADILTGLVLALHKGAQRPTNKQGDRP